MEYTNINYILRYVKDFVDGKISRLEFESDFPTEFEAKIEGIEEESPDFSDTMNQYLIEDGLEQADGLSDIEFRKLMWKQYQLVRDEIC